MFSKYGEILDVYIPRNFYTREPREYAYVAFAVEEDAEAAMRKVNDTTVDGRKIRIEWAQGDRKNTQEMKEKEL